MENLWQVGLDCVKSAFVSPFKRHATGLISCRIRLRIGRTMP